jgi:hypothetical protein
MSAIARSLQIDAWIPTEAQGEDHKKLREAAGEALRHWQRRSEYLLSAEVSCEDHNSVPLKTAFTARITYKHVGPLKPLPYPLDE